MPPIISRTMATERNLLECVRTYTHKVASLNAANAWMNRTLAEIEERRGETRFGPKAPRDAQAIAQAVSAIVSTRGIFCLPPAGWLRSGGPALL